MKVADVKKVAVFGAGTMGPGLAQVFATAGYDVSMYSRKAETLEKAGCRSPRPTWRPSSRTACSPESQVPDVLARIS